MSDPATVVAWLGRRAERTPRRAAFEAGSDSLDFGTLARSARQVAAALGALGVGPGDRSVLAAESGFPFIEALHGILASGAAVASVNPAAAPSSIAGRARLVRARLVIAPSPDAAAAVRQALSDTAPRPDPRGGTVATGPPPWLPEPDDTIAAPDTRQPAWPRAAGGSGSACERRATDRPHASAPSSIDAPRVVAIDDLLAAARTERPAPAREIDPDSPAVLLFTSGTTGDPKAAVILHRHLVAQFEAHRRSTGAGEADTLVNWSPLFHNMGLARAGLAAPVYGWRCVLVPPGLSTVRLWLQTIAARRATITASADSGFRAAAERVDPHGIDLRSLRYAISGGEGVRADTIVRFEQRFGLERIVTPGYGLSEATLGVSMLRPGEPLRVDSKGRVTNGRPHAGFTVRIVDDRGTDVPNGVPGGVLVAGPSVFAGYFDDGPATRAVLRDGWLDTGDVGALDADGHLYIHGRRKALIKRAGVTIAPRDVEEAACSVAGIAVAATVGLAGTPDEDESLVVVAEVDPGTASSRPGGVPDLAGAVARAVARAVGATPERVVLVGPGQLPRTDTGKVRDAAVRSLIAPMDRHGRDRS